MAKNSKTKQLILAIVLVVGFVGESLGMNPPPVDVIPRVNIRRILDSPRVGAAIVLCRGFLESIFVPSNSTQSAQGNVIDSRPNALRSRLIEGASLSSSSCLLRGESVVAPTIAQPVSPALIPVPVSSGSTSRPWMEGVFRSLINVLPLRLKTSLESFGPQANQLLDSAQGTLTTVNRVTVIGGTVFIIGGGCLLYRKASHSKQQAEAIKQKTETQKIVNAQKQRELEVQLQKDAIDKQERWKKFVLASQDAHHVSQDVVDPHKKVLCLRAQDQMFKDGLKAFGYVEPEPKKKSWLGTIKDTFNDTADDVPLVDEVV